MYLAVVRNLGCTLYMQQVRVTRRLHQERLYVPLPPAPRPSILLVGFLVKRWKCAFKSGTRVLNGRDSGCKTDSEHCQ